MSTGSSIEWTDATWNPVIGCTPVSPGCLNCYAAGMARRHRKNPSQPAYHDRAAVVDGKTVHLPVVDTKNGRAVFTGEVRELIDRVEEPFRWRKPRLVFVNSMSDLFHEKVTREFQARVFAVMGLASWHTYQVLTKRPEIMADTLNDPDFAYLVEEMSGEYCDYAYEVAKYYGYFDPQERLSTDWAAQDHLRMPMPNVWVGTSCENQAMAEERVPWLLKCPAAVRFVSAEPLLGPIDFTALDLDEKHHSFQAGAVPFRINALSQMDDRWFINSHRTLDQVIAGGESGPHARPCSAQWIRSIVGQCGAAGRAVFVKQMGSVVYAGDDAGSAERWPRFPDVIGDRNQADDTMGRRVHLEDSKGGDMSEWPEDLRVRQWPQQANVSV